MAKRRKAGLSILDVMKDLTLFGREFGGGSWRAWRVFLKALFGLEMDAEDLEIYRKHTGRKREPTKALGEAWVAAGRRGGKSRVGALLAVFLACFRDYSKVLAAGERGVVMVLANDRKQAQVVFKYIKALLQVPLLSRLVVRETADTIDLGNDISVEVHTSSYRSVRGRTIVAAVLDEIAFWDDPDTANPDIEVVNALRPGMATVPGSMLLAISTPYARRGVLWDAFDKHYGRDDSDVLVWQAPTMMMNPTLSESVVHKAFESDPVAAASEYGAEFRRDIAGLFSIEALEAVTKRGRYELAPSDGANYGAFVDPSGGSYDSFTLAIGHSAWRPGGETVVLDCVRERRPPFSPEDVVEEYANLLRSYHLADVTGDRYAGSWVAETFAKHGISYRPADLTRSQLYLAFLPIVNSGRVELLDDKRLITQLSRLERRTSRSGQDSVDHPRGSHDDIANAVAGVASLLTTVEAGPMIFTAASLGLYDDDEDDRKSRRWSRVGLLYNPEEPPSG